jgi:4'-phosphopantetheinyl transferase
VEAGQVETWLAPVVAIGGHHRRVLTAIEREREQGYLRPEDRHRFLAGVALSRLVLAQVLGVEPAEIEIDRRCPDCDRPHGRPELPGHPDVDLSVSHSGGWIVCAVARGVRVGVDLQQADAPVGPELADLALSPAERSEWRRRGSDPAFFYRLWVAKEAVLKVRGVGLRVPMSTVVLDPHGHTRAERVWPLTAPAGYSGAVAVRGDAPDAPVEHDGERVLTSFCVD